MDIGIIGLGQFGLHLGHSLGGLGHNCVGMDISKERVQTAKDAFSQVFAGDATDKGALSQTNIFALDNVIVALGDRLEMSILTIMNLQDLGTKKIIARAASPLHKKVLERMGVHRIVQPEIDSATRLAYNLDNPGLIELLPIGRGVAIQEMKVDKWSGKTLRELNLRNKSKILVTAIRKDGSKDFSFIPDPDTKLEKGESLLIIGYADKVAKIADNT